MENKETLIKVLSVADYKISLPQVPRLIRPSVHVERNLLYSVCDLQTMMSEVGRQPCDFSSLIRFRVVSSEWQRILMQLATMKGSNFSSIRR